MVDARLMELGHLAQGHGGRVGRAIMDPDTGEVTGRIGGYGREIAATGFTPAQIRGAVKRRNGKNWQLLKWDVEDWVLRHYPQFAPHQRGVLVAPHGPMRKPCSTCKVPHSGTKHRSHGPGSMRKRGQHVGPMMEGVIRRAPELPDWVVNPMTYRAKAAKHRLKLAEQEQDSAYAAFLAAPQMLTSEMSEQQFQAHMRRTSRIVRAAERYRKAVAVFHGIPEEEYDGNRYAANAGRAKKLPKRGRAAARPARKAKKSAKRNPATLIYPASRGISIRGMKKGPGHPCDRECKEAGHRYKHTFTENVQIIGRKDGTVLLRKATS